jgi:DNA-binding MarR family transcriptional regulator
MTDFDLQGFLPFRLSRLSYEVSNQMAEIYSSRFDISIPEWRVMATLAEKKQCTAQAIVASTRTHKSTISRAVSRLIKNNWIERVSSKEDKRMHLLRMSESGEQRFVELSPLVLKFEKELNAKMSLVEVAQLNESIAKLEAVLELGAHNNQRQLDL